jgi:hypothetical protein
MESYGATKLVGEDATEFSTSQLQLAISQLNPADVQKRLSDSSMKDYFRLPEGLDLGQDPVQVQVLKSDALANSTILPLNFVESFPVQTLFSQNNLYSWDPTAAVINTPNVELSFSNSQTGSHIDLSNLTKPIHIVLPLKRMVD